MADKNITEGDQVAWNISRGSGHGIVSEIATEGSISITTEKGAEVKRNANEENPAVRVENTGKGQDVVKKMAELSKEGDESKEGEVQGDDSEYVNSDADVHNEGIAIKEGRYEIEEVDGSATGGGTVEVVHGEVIEAEDRGEEREEAQVGEKRRRGTSVESKESEEPVAKKMREEVKGDVEEKERNMGEQEQESKQGMEDSDVLEQAGKRSTANDKTEDEGTDEVGDVTEMMNKGKGKETTETKAPPKKKKSVGRPRKVVGKAVKVKGKEKN